MREDPNKLRNKRGDIATGIAETQMILKACYEQLIIRKVGNLKEMTDICLHVCALCACSACGGQQRVSDPLELDLRMNMICHAGTGIQTHIL